MKILGLCLSYLFFLVTPTWTNNFDSAKKEAAASNKMILVNFSGSDWCGPCIKLKKEVLDTETFLKYADDKFLLVRADFPRAKKNKLDVAQTARNEALAEKYNPEGKFPYLVLINAQGKIVKAWDGYPKVLALENIKTEINRYLNATK